MSTAKLYSSNNFLFTFVLNESKKCRRLQQKIMSLTFQFQGGIQTVKMVFFDLVDLGYESDNLGKYNPETQVVKQL